MRHNLDVLDTLGDKLYPAVIPRVCDNDIIILLKEGRAVCTLSVYGISDCRVSECPLKVYNRCVCMFNVKGDKISLFRSNRCPMRLKHVDTLLEDL